MKIFAISDTHGLHEQLIIPDGIDMIIHAGDVSNYRDSDRNSNEVALFLNWYESLDIKHKILIAGNHDTSIERRIMNPRDFKSITYLEHESAEIDGIRFFGSPYTPTFNDWSFMKARHNMFELWEAIPQNTDVLITHGGPWGILDLSINHKNEYEVVGDKSLGKRVLIVNPMYHIFGHIHNCEEIKNAGTRTIGNRPTTYINASCVTDGQFKLGLTSNGHVFEI